MILNKHVQYKGQVSVHILNSLLRKATFVLFGLFKKISFQFTLAGCAKMQEKVPDLSYLVAIWAWPSGKLPFDCQKIAKSLRFFSKKWTKNCHFFKWQFLSIFFFKCQVFGNFLTFKWQFSGGSGYHHSFSNKVQVKG